MTQKLIRHGVEFDKNTIERAIRMDQYIDEAEDEIESPKKSSCESAYRRTRSIYPLRYQFIKPSIGLTNSQLMFERVENIHSNGRKEYIDINNHRNHIDQVNKSDRNKHDLL